MSDDIDAPDGDIPTGLELWYRCHLFETPRDGAIYAACHRWGAVSNVRWWGKQGSGEISDRDLRCLLGKEFGPAGSMEPSLGYWGYECRGGPEPILELRSNEDEHRETLSGQQLLNEVRRVMHMGYPDGAQIPLL
jgi:hypothetical protein